MAKCEQILGGRNIHETESGDHLNDREREFSLAVTSHAEEIDRDDDDQKYSHPYGGIYISCPFPIIEGYEGRHDLNWQGY